jgi:hypothetical protein
LTDLFDNSSVWYDPIDGISKMGHTKIKEDAALVAIHYQLEDQSTFFYTKAEHVEKQAECSCNWLFRFALKQLAHGHLNVLGQQALLKRLEALLPSSVLHECMVTNSGSVRPVLLRLRFHCQPFGDYLPIETEQDATVVMKWLCTHVLAGIKGMESAIIMPYPVATSSTYCIGATGIDARQLLSCGDPLIDINRFSCNDITIMNELYGIEVARAKYIEEVRAVFNGFQLGVNYRHFSLMADYMTQNGTLRPFTFHGRLKSRETPFLSASFERTDSVFAKAALYQSQDNCRTPSARIMMGHTIAAGTGLGTDVENKEMVRLHGRPQEAIVNAYLNRQLDQWLSSDFNGIELPARRPKRRKTAELDDLYLLHRQRLMAIPTIAEVAESAAASNDWRPLSSSALEQPPTQWRSLASPSRNDTITTTTTANNEADDTAMADIDATNAVNAATTGVVQSAYAPPSPVGMHGAQMSMPSSPPYRPSTPPTVDRHFPQAAMYSPSHPTDDVSMREYSPAHPAIRDDRSDEYDPASPEFAPLPSQTAALSAFQFRSVSSPSRYSPSHPLLGTSSSRPYSPSNVRF